MTLETKISIAAGLIRISIIAMVLNFFLAIITGPEFAHYINLTALFLTFIALMIFYKNIGSVDFKYNSILIQILLNISLGIGQMLINYGYFNR